MNPATSTMPWMAASLLAAISVFGQNQNVCSQQKMQANQVQKNAQTQEPQMLMMSGYNAPAETKIQSDYDLFASASFIYWQSLQDNVNVALTNTQPSNSVTSPVAQGSFVGMSFDYHPGFKLGLGMNLNYDNWYGYLEYTRVHGAQSASLNSPASGVLLSTWGHAWITGAAQVFQTAYGSFRNNLDFLDGEMGRVYYIGNRLVCHSGWGMRAALILENYHARYVNTTAGQTTYYGGVYSLPGQLDVYARSISRAIGPRAGVAMDWTFCYGLKMFGSGYADVLYSRYKVQDKTNLITAVPGTHSPALSAGNPAIVITRTKVGALRAHLDFEMGLGWDSYFDNDCWHVDLSASYGFQVFFNQNMFRHFDNEVIGSNTIANGNLYVQGLTTTFRLDF